jgi:hypothetical protein
MFRRPVIRMQDLPFHPFSPRPRNATLGLLLIGASFLLPISAFFAYYGYHLQSLAIQSSRSNNFAFNSLLGLLVVYVFPVAAKRLFHIGAAMRMPDAIEMLNTDNRAPILYLRSFDDDGVTDLTTQIIPWSPTQTVEMRVTQALGELGPVVSIGRPGERLPELGANRFYVSNAEWKDAVLYFIKCSSAVVIVVGRTPGVSWEIRTALESVSPEKLLLVFPYLLPKQERSLAREVKELIRKKGGKTDLVTKAMLSDIRKERGLRYCFFCKEFADTIPCDMPSLSNDAVFIDFLSDGFPRLLTTCQSLLIRRFRDQQSLTIDYRRTLRPFIEKLSRHPIPPDLLEKVFANRSTLQMFTVVCLICLVVTFIGMLIGGGPFSLAGAVASFICVGLLNLLYWSIWDLHIMARPGHEATKDNHLA